MNYVKTEPKGSFERSSVLLKKFLKSSENFILSSAVTSEMSVYLELKSYF